MNGLDINTIFTVAITTYVIVMLFVWGIFVKWLSKSIHQDKQKVKIIYIPLYKFLLYRYHNLVLEYHIDPKMGDKSMELLKRIEWSKNKLLELGNTRNDNKLLDGLARTHRDCHFKLERLIEQNKGKIPLNAYLTIEDTIAPIRDIILKKINKYY